MELKAILELFGYLISFVWKQMGVGIECSFYLLMSQPVGDSQRRESQLN